MILIILLSLLETVILLFFNIDIMLINTVCCLAFVLYFYFNERLLYK